MRRTTASPALAIALACLAAGCGGAGDRPLPEPLPTDVPFAYHTQTQPGGDGALLEGTLELQDGCLVVLPIHDGTQEPVVPVVPVVATTWDGTTLTVNASSAAVGEEISLGGGFHARPPDGAVVPECCPPATTDRYVVVGLE